MTFISFFKIFLFKNSHPKMIPNLKYYLLLLFIILLASVGVWHWKQGNNEDQIIEQFDNVTLDTNETETINYKNGKRRISYKNLEARNDSGQWPILMTTTRKPRQIPMGPKLYNDSEVDSKWRIRMVQNLRWDLSKSFLAVSYLNLESQTMPDRERSGDVVAVIGPHYYPNSRMSFFYGIDFPNMLIRFKQTKNGAAFCEFGQLKESVLRKTQKQLNDWKWENCLYIRKPFLKESNLPLKKQFFAFCPVTSADDGSAVFSWRLANGTYNPPSKTPHCIYDFHRKATEPDEYHLLKYCSKAYFFNGFGYNVSNKRMRNRRKDWILFLAEGQLKCSISGDIQTDMDLIGKGYTVELIQYSLPTEPVYDLENQLSQKCPVLKATLVKYEDKMKEGKFIIAGVVGGAELDGDLRKATEEESVRFWDKNIYNGEKYKYMSFEDKQCYIFYQYFLRDLQTKRYHLQLEISHFCTERGMRGRLEFDVSIGPEQVPEEGIYEDNGIQIDLYKGQMRRSTNQIINARKNVKPATQGTENTIAVESPIATSPSPYPTADGSLFPGAECSFTRECGYGYRCGNVKQQTFCDKIADPHKDPERFLLDQGLLCTKELGQRLYKEYEYNEINDYDPHCILATNTRIKDGGIGGPNKINCQFDANCSTIDEFCVYSGGECHKFRFLMHGEICYINTECFPNSRCQINKGIYEFGKCENLLKFNQAAEEPNDPLD